MREIFSALYQYIKFLFGTLKPLCEQALEHPLFKVLALPVTVFAAIAGLWKFYKWLSRN